MNHDKLLDRLITGHSNPLPVLTLLAWIVAVYKGYKTVDDIAVKFNLDEDEKTTLSTALNISMSSIQDKIGLNINLVTATPEQLAYWYFQVGETESKRVENILLCLHTEAMTKDQVKLELGLS